MEEICDSCLSVVEEAIRVILGGFYEQRDVLAEARAGPLLGFVHGVVYKVLLVSGWSVTALAAPLCEFPK